jgi:MATE family multidrug resistance protein
MSTEIVARAPVETSLRGGAREVLALAYPVVLTQLSQTLMFAVDAAMVGRLGATELGAVGFGGIWIWTALCFFMGTVSGVQTFVSQEHGAGDARRAGRWVAQALAGVLPLALVGLGAFVLGLPSWLRLLGPSEALQQHCVEYVHGRAFGLPADLFCLAIAAFFRGIGDTKTPLYVTIGANVVNAFLAYGLIFGSFGLPQWGVFGAGVAMSAATWVYLFTILACFVRADRARRYETRTVSIDAAGVERYLRTSLPIGGQWLLDMSAFALFSTLVARMGDVSMAANQALLNLLSFTFMLAYGISISCATLVGRYVGAADFAAAERSFKSSLGLALVLAAVVSIAFVTIPGPLFRIFSNDPGVLALGGPLLLLAAAFQLLDALGIVVGGALRGAGDTSWPFAVQTALAWGLRVPLVWWFGVSLGKGVTGAWLAELVYIWVLGAVFFWRFRGGAWKRVKI